ncbi:esterase/lipase family protein [Chondromyces crocatus]|uniref:esterase/lipase family protein n=1 Tax=Chondromyces crocatus TaxID=52 RepID=UPI00067D4962|nr:hypothetical protein [Chondromyces crocatus]
MLVLGLLAAACGSDPEPGPDGSGGAGAGAGGGGAQGGEGGTGGQGAGTSEYPSEPVAAPFDVYFDPPVDERYADAHRVVGAIEGPLWGWGTTELLEGFQAFRSEGYNLRTQKLRWEDTYEDASYPLRTFNGELNQHLVDAFNLHYAHGCAGTAGMSGAVDCPAPGPTRPEARFVLLHHGPDTAALACDRDRTPVLLVHGALQNGNVWLFPGGNDGAGNAYPGTVQTTGFVQALEAEGVCTFAVTFGSFHGDNFNQATHLSNAVARIREITGAPKVDVVGWSKGVVAADLYLADVATWDDWGPKHFERLAAEQARRVPRFDADVRTYVALSGPHLGLDLNWRHPYNNLLIASTEENAPIGQGPMVWSWMKAMQCVSFGYGPQNVYAVSVCEDRGATWLDYWRRIYFSNITGLDDEGRPVTDMGLGELNAEQGLAASAYEFDKYNLALWGSIDDSGKHVSAYWGQLQVAYDLRSAYPIPNRQDDPPSYDWSQLDTDETKWRDWLQLKVDYLPTPPFTGAGALLDDAGHTMCRHTAYEPEASVCEARHVSHDPLNAEEYAQGYARYRLMGGLGMAAAMEMGGNLIERLRGHGLSPALDSLYVVHGTTAGAPGTAFEIDGMDCPTCDPHGDGVLFDVSIAARDQLTQGWSEEDKATRSKQDGVPHGHLEVGVSPEVWSRILDHFAAVP